MVRRNHTIIGFATIFFVFVLLPLFTRRCEDTNEESLKSHSSRKFTKPSSEKWNQTSDEKLDSRSTDCSVRLADPDTFPLVPLISPPGAGSTWLRHLIEQATGFYTGSVFDDKGLYGGGFLGEYEDYRAGNTLTVKVHNVKRLSKFCKAAILLLRNPIDIVIAEKNRQSADGHLGEATWRKDSRTDEDWNQFAYTEFERYERIVNDFSNLTVPTLIVHYENIKNDSLTEVKRIVDFLNMTVNEERKICAENNGEGHFHRHKSDAKTPYKTFTDEMICDALALMEKASKLIAEKGHQPLPCLQDHPVSNCYSVSKTLSSVKHCA
ncbi:sialate:O-sulfotransferase 1-like [Ptychodera flava]|uniref:sialate:O-sulfotransferase 1-like n=1 Tax=Ptychodera flava TaxID=63121 RepID=UPI00396A0691